MWDFQKQMRDGLYHHRDLTTKIVIQRVFFFFFLIININASQVWRGAVCRLNDRGRLDVCAEHFL